MREPTTSLQAPAYLELRISTQRHRRSLLYSDPAADVGFLHHRVLPCHRFSPSLVFRSVSRFSMAPQVSGFDRISSIRAHYGFHRRLASPKLANRLDVNKFRFNLEVLRIGARGCFSVPAGAWMKRCRRLNFSVARGNQPERVELVTNEEGKRDSQSSEEANLDSQRQQRTSQVRKRISFGLGIGFSALGVVLVGSWVFTMAIATAILIGSREYFELVRSHGIASGVTPPPQYVSRACSVIYSLMPILTLYLGNIDVSVTTAAFLVTMALLLQQESPRFTQLSSAIFGLLYCGYLPCFWVKLRCLEAPSLNTRFVASWPLLLGGQSVWTVGLVSTLISISSIIAADSFAFFVGKAFGRTQLTAISPKKTWEGTLAGLSGCIATSVLLAKILCWPSSVLRVPD
ncbi:phosphatidate cytidylyltransferase 5, chloroplastic-like isoform X2 [Andrographis paniculata]|uniref:phosphatidate cytidylyltransferase 5, chloroplastic-like isoform X2 n=1 Tax=Andrographis paniculata TaxID=175694 RepID=UPI0021E80770|nr:phosphatidate cytidylyltransferase 5, chloroplastic-like isoform X2 [Andrographis paniculata]